MITVSERAKVSSEQRTLGFKPQEFYSSLIYHVMMEELHQSIVVVGMFAELLDKISMIGNRVHVCTVSVFVYIASSCDYNSVL